MTGSRREVWLDPIPDDELESLRSTLPRVAVRIDEALDWIEADPPNPRSGRRRFSNGMWAISITVDTDDWIVLWDEDETNRPVVRFLGESSSI